MGPQSPGVRQSVGRGLRLGQLVTQIGGLFKLLTGVHEPGAMRRHGSRGEELTKYPAALRGPRNTETRGVEVVTNNSDSVAYWRVMMAAYDIKGYSRHVR